MTIRAAVIDPLPLYRHGVVAALHTVGCAVDEPDDLDGWLNDSGQHVVVVGLCSPADWELLAATHHAHPDVTFLALVSDPAIENLVRAIMAGAVGVLPRDGSPDALREAFGMLVTGRSPLPIDVIGRLARTTTSATEEGADSLDDASERPTAQEIEWLRHFASGGTVADLAHTARYSERMMYRLLRSLYTKMAVSGRTEALMLARDNGWI